MSYHPPQKIIDNYANVLVNFALGGGTGIKKGEVVRVSAGESAKPLYVALVKAVVRAGGHVIGSYSPDDDKIYRSKDFFDIATNEHLDFFPAKYYRGLIDTIDHLVAVSSETNKEALKGVDPAKIMRISKAGKPMHEWMDEKENQGKFTWTVCLYGTEAMAREAGLSEKQYWQQIIKACFLDEPDPIKKWKTVTAEIETFKDRLNELSIERLHMKGKDVDLHITLGEKRKWAGGTGRNIPSFEIFTSPDWRGTNGWIKFNIPLYRYGNIVEGIRLEFKDGVVVKATAKKNAKILKEMIKAENADKIGEYSLTDSRHSRITKFMAETLYDENIGGKFGNSHIAVGKSYHDCYDGDPAKVNKAGWEKLGFNDSAVHTDMFTTTDRTVTATLKDGSKKIIYSDGQFQV